MGGSLGLALGALPGTTVTGWDPDRDALRAAVELGAIGAAAPSLEAACEGACAVVLGAPVSVLAGLARRALAATADDCLVTDLGSAKSAVLAALSPGDRERFIGGHPVCGAERTGVAFARAELFRGATWFLTPGAEARPDLFERLHALVASVGARPVAIDAAVHDRLMALVSHVPHVLASALVNQAAATAPAGREALRSAGPSFHDLTRVAGSNPPLWADILLANGDAVVAELRAYGRRLADVEDAITRGDREWLLGFVGEAARGRERLLEAEPDGPAEPARVLVAVPNRPGAISEIATALGHAHINIEDLSLRPGPPDGEGELVLTVDGPEAALRAVRLIAERGYRAAAGGGVPGS
ncbi:prephenate dehydrogenase/arogenate dehydrogenase family protein [Miltoncostaea marina]|uniref:prephenate dehydrogenase/arogenate dehydrogenase family protein n=1 Tax=Miltoncostaea marina TaxID=2843215 RepID=UPI001C3E38C9|nr:prephenate dehydrogenase/arogenate dehydrogenase family protein [Miltoncostaea marina]